MQKLRDYSNSRYHENKGNPDFFFKKKTHSLRKRAKKKNIPFNLTWEFLKDLWVNQEGKCSVTSIPLVIGASGRNKNAASVDRVVPEKGYIKDNVRLVTYGINIAIQNWGLEEFVSLAKSILHEENKNVI